METGMLANMTKQVLNALKRSVLFKIAAIIISVNNMLLIIKAIII